MSRFKDILLGNVTQKPAPEIDLSYGGMPGLPVFFTIPA